ncbi:MAG: ribbon-helix-helix domain-containing protein [Pseudomonadota bacterium]
MTGRPVKRSVMIAGHRTSVSLEGPFWHALQEMAAARGITITTLIQNIDATRDAHDTGLSGALRVAALQHFRALANRG